MPSTLPITVVVAVRNEAANIRRCLSALKPAERVIVVDSQSTDDTQAIALSLGAEVIQFKYAGGYPKKRQWALDHLELKTPWVFLIDADEVVPDALWSEIEAAIGRQTQTDAFVITKGFHFMGKRFRFGGFSHSAVLLFRHGKARFEELVGDLDNGQDMEVHERLLVNGSIERLKTPLIHQDFKGLRAYIDRHNAYSTWEAKARWNYLHGAMSNQTTIKPRLFGNVQERRRWLKQIAIRVPCEPALWFCYHFIFKCGFLEGRRGLIASQIRASYIAQARGKLCEIEFQHEHQ